DQQLDPGDGDHHRRRPRAPRLRQPAQRRDRRPADRAQALTVAPDAPIDPGRAALLLGAILLGLVLLGLRDRSVYKRFKALTESKARIRPFRRWVIGAFLVFGLGGVLVLWLAGRVGDLLHMPHEFAAVGALLTPARLGTSGLFGIAFGVTFV